jgi:hypothetical protein
MKMRLQLYASAVPCITDAPILRRASQSSSRHLQVSSLAMVGSAARMKPNMA